MDGDRIKLHIMLRGLHCVFGNSLSATPGKNNIVCEMIVFTIARGPGTIQLGWKVEGLLSMWRGVCIEQPHKKERWVYWQTANALRWLHTLDGGLHFIKEVLPRIATNRIMNIFLRNRFGTLAAINKLVMLLNIIIWCVKLLHETMVPKNRRSVAYGTNTWHARWLSCVAQ